MLPDWIVLVPPLLVIGCVYLTRRIILAFLLGIISSALIVTNGNVLQATTLALQRLWGNTGLSSLTSVEAFLSGWNLLVFLFLIFLGILIVILSKSGAAQAYVGIVSKYVSSKKEAESASLILSLFFFIDDYFSVLTVGSVMRPLTRRFGIHPVKLAFLVTTMASPLVILTPISSWVGEIVLQLKQAGIVNQAAHSIIAADPYLVFTSAIPYLLYPILLVLSTWYIVLRGISYGPMQKYDDMHETEEVVVISQGNPATMIDFLVPIITLVVTVFGTMLYTGNSTLFGGTETFISAIKNASLSLSFFTGGLVSLIVSIILCGTRGTIERHNIGPAIVEGFSLMFPSILMLICAWSLGAILKNDLKTGSYIASQMGSIISIELFPLICFMSTAITALMIGSAWATIGLMFPIVIDMLQKLLLLTPQTPLSSVPLLIPLVGATLSGTIMGVQLSVISDNPIMSAASTGADHLTHIKTMAWYVIPIGFSAAAGFTTIGLLIDTVGCSTVLAIGLCVSLVLTLALLELGQLLFHKKTQ